MPVWCHRNCFRQCAPPFLRRDLSLLFWISPVLFVCFVCSYFSSMFVGSFVCLACSRAVSEVEAMLKSQNATRGFGRHNRHLPPCRYKLFSRQSDRDITAPFPGHHPNTTRPRHDRDIIRHPPHWTKISPKHHRYITITSLKHHRYITESETSPRHH